MIVFDANDLKRAFEELKHIPNAGGKAVSATVNKGVSKANTLIKRYIAKEYNLQKKDVAKHIKVTRSTWDIWKFQSSHGSLGYLTGGVYIMGHRIGWEVMGMEPKDVPNQLGVKIADRPRVSIQIKKDKGNRKVFEKGVFIARVKAGKDKSHVGVFVRGTGKYNRKARHRIERKKGPWPGRPGKERWLTTELPIKAMKTIAVPEMMIAQKVSDKIKKEVFSYMDRALTGQIEAFLEGKRK